MKIHDERIKFFPCTLCFDCNGLFVFHSNVQYVLPNIPHHNDKHAQHTKQTEKTKNNKWITVIWRLSYVLHFPAIEVVITTNFLLLTNFKLETWAWRMWLSVIKGYIILADMYCCCIVSTASLLSIYRRSMIGYVKICFPLNQRHYIREFDRCRCRSDQLFSVEIL